MHPLSRGYLTSLCPVHSLGRDRVGPYNTQWCERLFLQPEARIVDHRRGRVDRFCCHYLSPFIAVGPFGFYFLPRQVVAVSFAPALSPEPRQVVAQLRGAGEGTRTLDNLLGRQGPSRILSYVPVSGKLESTELNETVSEGHSSPQPRPPFHRPTEGFYKTVERKSSQRSRYGRASILSSEYLAGRPSNMCRSFERDKRRPSVIFKNGPF